MRVAIHQPNFMPWMGLFQKLYLADVFVLLDHVQASGGRSWLSRNRLIVGGRSTWLTVPIHKSGRFGQRIRDVEINYQADFVSKLLRTIEYNYRKAPFYDQVIPAVSELFKRRHKHIGQLNTEFIRWVCSYLGISVRFVSSSDLASRDTEIGKSSGNTLVLEICRAARATTYISGNGCLHFIEPASFERAGIVFRFQRFEHHRYCQIGSREFISHLSILDALLNVGAEETARLVCQTNLSSSASGMEQKGRQS